MKCRRQGVDPFSHDVTSLRTDITLTKTEYTALFITTHALSLIAWLINSDIGVSKYIKVFLI